VSRSFGVVASSNYIANVVQITDQTFVMDAPGDDEGLFYALGSNFGTVVFDNPLYRGLGMRVSSFTPGFEPWYATDRVDETSWFSSNVAGSWIEYDLGPSVELKVSNYTVKGRYNYDNYPRSWNVEASSDGTVWTVIDERINDATVVNDGWYSFQASSSNQYYRYFRFIATGLTSEGNNYFGYAGVEFYGDLKTQQFIIDENELDLSNTSEPGLFEWIATQDGAESWVHPLQRGQVSTSSTNWYAAAYSHHNVIDNNASSIWAVNTALPSQEAIFDIGQYYKIRLCNYAFTTRNDFNDVLLSWTIQGSNDLTTWITLVNKVDDVLAAKEAGTGVRGIYPMTYTQDAYRYFKIIMDDGANPSGISLAAFEVWGALQAYDMPALPAGATRYIPTNLSDFDDVNHNHAITISVSSTAIGDKSYINDSNLSTDFLTTDAASQWVKFTYDDGTVRPDSISLHSRSQFNGDQALRAFLVEGSNDDSSWETIRDVQVLDYYWHQSGWGFWFIPSTDDAAYKHIRITQTATNTSGANYLTICEAEIYGDYIPD